MNLEPIIRQLIADLEDKGGRAIEIRYEQEDNNLLCFAPYDDADKKHLISLEKSQKESNQVDLLFDLLRLEDHLESTRIFDLAQGILSYDAILVYGIYGLVTAQRVLRRLLALGVTGEQWAPLVEPYANYKRLFLKKNQISPELKPHWDVIVGHAYADSLAMTHVVKLPSARQAVKTLEKNLGNEDGKKLGKQIFALLADFQDSRLWVEDTFLKIMELVKMDGMLEIREAATGKVLQAPRQSFIG